jgi:hypothetical protein
MGGMTEYLVVTLALVVLCVCAIVAYTGLDAIERDEEERARWARHQRAIRPVVATPVPLRAATSDIPVPFARPRQRWHGGSVTAHADWLEERVRGVEEHLDQLVRDSQRASRA